MAYREAKDGLSKPITPLENPLEKLNRKLETASIQNLFVLLIATTSVIEWFCLSMCLVCRFIFYWSVYIVVSCMSNIYLTYAGIEVYVKWFTFSGIDDILLFLFWRSVGCNWNSSITILEQPHIIEETARVCCCCYCCCCCWIPGLIHGYTWYTWKRGLSCSRFWTEYTN